MTYAADREQRATATARERRRDAIACAGGTLYGHRYDDRPLTASDVQELLDGGLSRDLLERVLGPDSELLAAS